MISGRPFEADNREAQISLFFSRLDLYFLGDIR